MNTDFITPSSMEISPSMPDLGIDVGIEASIYCLIGFDMPAHLGVLLGFGVGFD